MCGIMGYIGGKEALPIVLDGLKRLEYRGYDSAGVAVLDSANGDLLVRKASGRLDNLLVKVEAGLPSHIGVGHTRWATHGAPKENNSHPHADATDTLCVIHNGIIENYKVLKDELLLQGIEFRSETDTEVIPNLLYATGLPMVEALPLILERLKGAYALVVLDKRNPEEIWVARQDSPLVIGLGEGESFLASDIPALLPYTRNMVFLENGERAKLTAEGVTFYDSNGKEIIKKTEQITWDADDTDKAGYAHYMLKEIFEQPKALRETLQLRLPEQNDGVFFPELDPKTVPWDWKNIRRIVISACGTAYYAGVAGKSFIEHFTRIPVETELASEFRYRDPILDSQTLVIIVSQSGETADTLGALRLANNKLVPTLAITNVKGSTVAREAYYTVCTQAGPEIAVASTKAYSTQILLLLLVALKIAKVKDQIADDCLEEWLQNLRAMPYSVENTLQKNQSVIQDLWAKQLCNVDDLFLIGRGLDYAVALEGALKLKELSYIYCEAYAAGELKHGPLALISEGTPVIAITSQDHLWDKAQSNIEVVKARGAKVYHISSCHDEDDANELTLKLPMVPNLLMPFQAVALLQLLAYYVALARGNEVDTPRNLAKSVTVE